MASLREIRRKIKSVKSTQQITKAMKMVAAARMRRAQGAILASRPFAVKLEATVRQLAQAEAAARAAMPKNAAPSHFDAYFKPRSEGKPCLILVTSDKGLCGAFNANLIRASIDWIRRQKGAPVSMAVVGKKGRDFIHRLKEVQPRLLSELAGIFPKVSFAHAELLGKPVLEAYLAGEISSVSVIYNEFKSVASQKIVEAVLLPVPGTAGSGENVVPGSALAVPGTAVEYQFEPVREDLLTALLPRTFKAQLYRILLESQASELAARMNAMDSASKNAGELIGSLTLGLNRTRQGIITREIAELVGGAEALAS